MLHFTQNLYFGTDSKTAERRDPFKTIPRFTKALAYTSKGKLLVARAVVEPETSAVEVWDGDTGEKTAVLQTKTREVSFVCFSSDCKSLAIVDGWAKIVQLWDIGTGKMLTSLKDLPGPVATVAFSHDGKLLALGYRPRADDNTGGGVRIYDLATEKILAELPDHTSRIGVLTFSPDGKLLASARESKIQLWTIPAAWTAGK